MTDRQFLDQMYQRLRMVRDNLAAHRNKLISHPLPLVKIGGKMVSVCDNHGAVLENWEESISCTIDEFLENIKSKERSD